MYVTIAQLKRWGACKDGFDRFMCGAGSGAALEDEVSLYDALDQGCEFSDITWALTYIELTQEQERDIRLLICTFARRALPLFEKEFPEDKRPRESIETAERFANGNATKEELAAAKAAALDAAWDAARANRVVQYAAAWAAAGDAAKAAARAAEETAEEAAWEARAAARAAARDAEEQAQKELLLEMLSKYK